MTYPDAVSAILHQHGWNLGWGGLTTVLCAPWVWRGDARAIFLAALVGGMLDAGYFLFLDLGGYVHFVPGTIMTSVSASAIGLSVYGHFATDDRRPLMRDAYLPRRSRGPRRARRARRPEQAPRGR